ncbi:Gfo/Idh/MocA family protein [Phycisphaerales bacterium AB-hyl4]|uniref:Gfo/Idh/MocA family protein n=1 Tax=Natronomicrosphaera hydrolytica TaxID=3242702 RepID=A0ABV4UBQ3_9BACT
MTKSKNLNVGLVGTQFMGRAHANAYLKVGRFFDLPLQPVMHTAAGRDPGRTQAFADRWGWANTTTRWQDMVESDAIDLIDICTPNNLHKDIALAALEAGKHVACEKPLSATLDEAREMRDAAKKAKRSSKAQTFVWFSYRGCPALALARQLVQDGKIGQVYHVRANYLQGWGGPATPLVWRFRKEFAGSGAHGDLNAHSIDAARFVTGEEITEVSGAIEETFIKQRELPGDEGGNIRGKGGAAKKKGKVTVDDTVMFLARFKGGAAASFEATRLAIGCQNENKLEVHGEKGAIRWNFEDMNVLWYYNAQGDAETNGWQRIMVTDADHHPFAHAWWPDAHILGYEHGFINLASTMFNQIGGGKLEVPMADFEDAYQTQRVLEAATLSARNRAPVKISEVK